MFDKRFVLHQEWKGAAWKVLACTFYAILNVIVRYLSTSSSIGPKLNPAEISCIQSFVTYGIIFPMIYRAGWQSLKTPYIGMHALRAGMGVGGVMLLYFAFSVMPVSQAVALGFLGPIFTVMLGWVYLKEPMRFLNVSGVFLGLLGAYFIVRPDRCFQNSGALFLQWTIWLPIGSSFCFAMSKILGRSLALLSEPTSRITNYFLLLMAPVSLIPALPVWVWPTATQWLWLVVLGGVGWMGHYSFARSYAYASVVFLTPFGFSRLLISALLAYGIFAEVPENLEFFVLGSGVIFLSTLFICLQEEKLKKKPE